MSTAICTVGFGTDEYQQIKQLRQDVLRTPIGLVLSEKDVAGEETQTHIAAIEHGQVVGSVILKPLEQDVMKLRQMAVAASHQGRGLGAKLVRFAEEEARSLGFAIIECNARITAQGFYEKLGWRTTGETFEEVGLPTIRMNKKL
ncbi:MAG: N-acetyltransferase [Proteobacteria bacterium]|nr:N-acetyltransferase [Pseudomonadota bacterium]